MKEEERILRRYRDHPFYDDTDLYYNGLCDSTQFLDHKLDESYKLAVYGALYSQWVDDNKPEKEVFKNQLLPHHIPQNKRSPRNRTIPETPNPMSVVDRKDTPEKGFRVRFKLAGNTIFSRKTGDDFLASISQNPPMEKRPRNEDESDRNKTKKSRNDEEVGSKLKARLQKDDAILVIKKRLTATDVNDSNCRLAIPESQIIDHSFLSNDEIKWLSGRDGKAARHLNVVLIEPSGQECDIKLARWTMGANVVYNLLSPWKLVVAKNGLRENTPVELYSFRDGPKLYFALIKIQT